MNSQFKKRVTLLGIIIPAFAYTFSFTVRGDDPIDVWIEDGKINGKSYYLVTKNVRLMPAGATFNGQIQIGADNVVFDGNHCTIDGSDFRSGDALTSAVSGMEWNSLYFPDDTTRYFKYIGIVTKRTNGVDQPSVEVSGSVIKNCIVKNWSNHGVYLRRVRERDADDFDGDGDLKEEIAEAAYFDGDDRSRLYTHSTCHISLVNMLITGNGRLINPSTGESYVTGDGIFVPAYSEFFHMQNLEITANGSVGIYLERESRFAMIMNCEIHHNWREGIAIDSSAHNMIFHNKLYYNNWIQDYPSRGGIKLYKNFGEYGIKRYQHSNFNQILHNTIHDERTGVWVASRQGAINAETRWVFDADALGEETFTYAGNDSTMMDYARHNTISYNTFYNNAHSHIRVEDDFTTIVKNTFGNRDNGEGHSYDVYLGNQFRVERGRPVSGTAIVGNTWSTGASYRIYNAAQVRTTSDELYSDDGVTESDINALDRPGIFAAWGTREVGYVPDQLF